MSALGSCWNLLHSMAAGFLEHCREGFWFYVSCMLKINGIVLLFVPACLVSAEIRDAVQRQQLKDEALEEAAAAAAAAKKQTAAATAAAAAGGEQGQQQQQQAQGFVRPPPLGKPAAGEALKG
jgi:hypothetical protein